MAVSERRLAYLRERRERLQGRAVYELEPDWLALLQAMRQRRAAERALSLPDAALETRKVGRRHPRVETDEEMRARMAKMREKKRPPLPPELKLRSIAGLHIYRYQQQWIAAQAAALGISHGAFLRGLVDAAMQAAKDEESE